MWSPCPAVSVPRTQPIDDHGGIRLRRESAAGRLFRKLAVFGITFGDNEHCTRILAQDEAGILAY